MVIPGENFPQCPENFSDKSLKMEISQRINKNDRHFSVYPEHFRFFRKMFKNFFIKIP